MEKYLIVTTLDYNDGNYVTGTFEVNKDELDFVVPYFKKIVEVQNEDMESVNNGTLHWNNRRRLNDILVNISKEENDLSAIKITFDKLYWGPRKEIYEYTKHYILKYFPINPEDSYDKQDYHTLVSFKVYTLEGVEYEGKQVDQEPDRTGRRVFNYSWKEQ
jgi:hypothetical protein